MSDLSPNVSIIPLNVSDLHTYQLKDKEWQSRLKNMTQLHAIYKKSHFKYNDIGKLKVKGQKNIYHANINKEWLH